mmetsp:Transcript_17171/g.56219  ORF Transcript_17171/g.56219 Transcript_17171/m.56219 type:complete len:214 (-) Transcript_17171:358-999(-)
MPYSSPAEGTAQRLVGAMHARTAADVTVVALAIFLRSEEEEENGGNASTRPSPISDRSMRRPTAAHRWSDDKLPTVTDPVQLTTNRRRRAWVGPSAQSATSASECRAPPPPAPSHGSAESSPRAQNRDPRQSTHARGGGSAKCSAETAAPQRGRAPFRALKARATPPSRPPPLCTRFRMGRDASESRRRRRRATCAAAQRPRAPPDTEAGTAL